MNTNNLHDLTHRRMDSAGLGRWIEPCRILLEHFSGIEHIIECQEELPSRVVLAAMRAAIRTEDVEYALGGLGSSVSFTLSESEADLVVDLIAYANPGLYVRMPLEVFRLNFRDHGPSHHLNQGIFFASRVDEVFDAVRRLSLAARPAPVFLVGFSLGANFALRIALLCGRRPIANLRHVVAISPVLDPQESTRRADRHPIIRRYFMKKWRRSLALKQRLFPNDYRFDAVLRSRTIQAATDLILERYSDFPSSRAYFEAYTLTGTALQAERNPYSICPRGRPPARGTPICA